MMLHRHDLVYADFDEEMLSGLGHRGLRDLILEGTVPGIVRREEGLDGPLGKNHYSEDETVYIGFVHPRKENGGRVRFGASISGADIRDAVTPFEIVRKDYHPRSTSLKMLKELGGRHAIGVWGSNALEIVTGLHYTDDTSDLDVLHMFTGEEDAMRLWKEVNELEGMFGTRIDVELVTSDGYGINLKEYVQGGDTLLAKGLRDVILINRKDIEKEHGPP